MPVRVCTGFNFGTTAGWATLGVAGNRVVDSTGGTPTIILDGSDYWLQISVAAAAGFALWDSNTIGGASNNRLAACFRLRFPSAIPAGNVELAAIGSPGADPILHYRTSGTQLAVSLNGGVNFTLGPTVVADTTYEIEIYSNMSANPHTFDWVVDGVAQTQVTNAVAANTIDNFRLGGTVVQTLTERFRDVVVWTDTANITFPVGTHTVRMLIPDTGGSTAEIGTANATARMVTNSAIDATHNSANILAALSEIPPLLGASASGIGQRTVGVGNACGIPMTSYTLAAGETLTAVRILVCCWAATATANQQGLRTFNGTTETILFAAGDVNTDNSTTAPAWLCKMATAADFDTQSELDAMVVRWGYSNDINPLPGAHAIYAEVAVKDSTGAAAAAPPFDHPIRRQVPLLVR